MRRLRLLAARALRLPAGSHLYSLTELQAPVCTLSEDALTRCFERNWAGDSLHHIISRVPAQPESELPLTLESNPL
jgi:hypothetical protein